MEAASQRLLLNICARIPASTIPRRTALNPGISNRLGKRRDFFFLLLASAQKILISSAQMLKEGESREEPFATAQALLIPSGEHSFKSLSGIVVHDLQPFRLREKKGSQNILRA